MDLVLWARSERIALTDVQVGMVRLVLADLTLAGRVVQPKATDEELKANLYAQYGGDALAEATREDDSQHTDDDTGYDGGDED